MEITEVELKNGIERIIKEAAANSGTETKYREPLIGFASADDPIFNEMKEIIGPYNITRKMFFPKQKPLFPSSCLSKKNL